MHRRKSSISKGRRDSTRSRRDSSSSRSSDSTNRRDSTASRRDSEVGESRRDAMAPSLLRSLPPGMAARQRRRQGIFQFPSIGLMMTEADETDGAGAGTSSAQPTPAPMSATTTTTPQTPTTPLFLPSPRPSGVMGAISMAAKKFHQPDGSQQAVAAARRAFGSVTSSIPSAVFMFTQKAPILTLAKHGEWAQVEVALKTMPKNDDRLNAADPDSGETTLMLACRDDRLVVIERLLDLGAAVNAKAQDKRTALHYAAAYCHDAVVKVLLSKKADPNVFGGILNQLPLHIVLSRKHGVHVTALTLLRATTREARTWPDGFGYLPISYAVQSGYFGIFRECLVFYQPEQLKWRHDSTGDTLVHIAAQQRNLEIMTYLAQECNANMNAQNSEGQTALHILTTVGDDMMVRMMQSFKADANIMDVNDQTPIHIAAELGHTTIVELLVQLYRAKVHLRTKDGSTLMHRAAEKGYVDTVDAFIRRGVALHMPNKNGTLALHVAAEKGHVEVVQLLVKKGSPVDSRNREGYTPLHLAVLNSHPEIIQELLGFGAKVDLSGGQLGEAPLHIAAKLYDGFSCAEMLIKSGAHVNKTTGETEETPLHIAAKHGYVDVMDMFLGEEGDPTKKSKSGDTVLHTAVRNCHLKIVVQLLRFMVERFSQADATALINTPNNAGETSFHYAATLEAHFSHFPGEEVKIVQILLDNGADPMITTRTEFESSLHYGSIAGNPAVFNEMVRHLGNDFQLACNRQNRTGRSALMTACEHGHSEITEILLRNNARADVFDELGKAALHLAAERGNVDCCEILLNYKAFVNAKSKLGFTPLHFAAQNGFVDLVKLLIEKYHAAVNALSLDKKTPLHLAAENGRKDVCQLLMTLRGDANALDSLGQTPLHLAAENDHALVMRHFIKNTPELVTAANKSGVNSAHIAAKGGSISVIKELMRFNKTIVTAARSTNQDLPLHLAVSGGHSELVRYLIDAGSSATAENSEGMNSIHLAAKEGNVEVLLAIPSKPTLKIHSVKNGLAPIHVAAFFGNAEFVREILQHVDANIKTNAPLNAGSLTDPTLKQLISTDHGLSCLHLASFSGHANVVRQLLNVAGVETDVPTILLGRVPMHFATMNGHLPVVSILMSRSSGLLSVEDARGRKPLHLASENGHMEMVSNLLGQGAEINAGDDDGWTPLHFATKNGFLDLVKVLVESGASPILKTSEGKTALMLAAAGGHIAVLSYLVKKDHNTDELMEENGFLMDLMLCSKTNDNESIDEFVDNSKAPLYTAARLAKLYRELAFNEKERAKDLNDAGRYLEHMATELLGIASAMAPPSAILRAINSKGNQLLDMLLEDSMKEVIEHAAVQRYLSDIWLGSLIHWPSKWLVLLFLGFMFCPPLWAYYCLPLASYHRYYHIPIIKFLALLVSHFYLIALLTVIAALPWDPILFRSHFYPLWYEIVCLAWVSGMLVSELTNQTGTSGLALLRPCIVAFSVAASLCQIAAVLYDGSTEEEHSFALIIMYTRNFMLSLALFSAIILTLDFLLIHHLFGEFGIIISAVMKELVVFMVVMFIFVLAFSFQLCCVYAPISKGPSNDANDTAANSTEHQLSSTSGLPFETTTLTDLAIENELQSGNGEREFVERWTTVFPLATDELNLNISTTSMMMTNLTDFQVGLNATNTTGNASNLTNISLAFENRTTPAGRIVNMTDLSAGVANWTTALGNLSNRTTTSRMATTNVSRTTTGRTTRQVATTTRRVIVTSPSTSTSTTTTTTARTTNGQPSTRPSTTLENNSTLPMTSTSTVASTLTTTTQRPSFQANNPTSTTKPIVLLNNTTMMAFSSTQAPFQIVTMAKMSPTTTRVSTTTTTTTRRQATTTRRMATTVRTTARPSLTTLRGSTARPVLAPTTRANNPTTRRINKREVEEPLIHDEAKVAPNGHCRPRAKPVTSESTAEEAQDYSKEMYARDLEDSGDEDVPDATNEDPQTLIDIFVLMYFGLFGMCQLETLPNVKNGPWWSRYLIEAYFGIYVSVTSIILIPLLISMLTETYKRIHQRSDAEWKFGRAKLIRNMIKLSAAPPPLNLFVRPYIYIEAVKKHGKMMFTIYANYFIAEDEHEGATEALEAAGRSTAGESRAKTTPRRTGGAKSALQGLYRRLLLTRVFKWLPCIGDRSQTLGKLVQGFAPGRLAPMAQNKSGQVAHDDGPQHIEDVLDWKMVVRRYRSGAASLREEHDDAAKEQHGETTNEQ